MRAPVPVQFPSEQRPEDAVAETKAHLEARTALYLSPKDALAAAHAIELAALRAQLAAKSGGNT